MKTFNKYEASRIDDLINYYRLSYHLVYSKIHTYTDHLKEFFKSFKCPASSDIHTISKRLDLLLNTNCYGLSPPFIDFRNVKFSQKLLYLCRYPPTPIDPYVCDLLGSSILLINDSINLIILIGLLFPLTI